ncbi:MAG: S-layer homology domain-containing protein [Armatimonadota bacterium]|nr:S-layer homology domain-containing protein [Armatimonadota bacterium]MDR7452045.1 S-layer homology domain-containing protein [Armatimonadota bacterium]MDR7466507.1 S-layer homology domain-containing protein [Armatimonadota bacterium]MDR7493229.1 S-layer homology domain-containing protein [Armatimonadota bacterium]MDR7499418.1 S-layer homology domain-containing protein [Armatimonadota bacterium]
MRKLAVAIAATLVLAVVSPAFSQPFADVPTDHWAFDAIAELAAKGIVEGYPDGTFKGDRAMTRYEIAMVVARILARIEAIKIPPPPPPPKIEVTRADITTLQRLINEFRAELAALGVRVTAVEEDLAALRDRLDNTKVAGFAFFRHQSNILNGQNYTFGLFNLTFTGRISSTASATVNMLLDTCDGGIFAFGAGTSSSVTPTGSGCSTTTGVALNNVDGGGYPIVGVTFDRAYIDVAAYGLNWRLGKQTYTLGPIGLLFREGSVAVYGGDSVGIDGLKVTGSFGPVSFEVAGFAYVYNPAAINVLQNIYTVRGSMALMPGWTFGLNYLSERTNGLATAPLTPNAVNSGWSVDVSGTIIPGVTLTAEYASWTPSGGSAVAAYQVNTVWNLGQLTGMTQFSPTLRIQYKNYGNGYLPIYRGGNDLFGIGSTTNYQAWNVQLSLTFSPQFRPYVNYESGSVISTGVGQTELELGFFSQITSGVTGRFRYQRRETPPGTVATHRYRLEVTTSW